jgi:hypothetical protein
VLSATLLVDLVVFGDSLTCTRSCADVLSALACRCYIVCCRQNRASCITRLQLMLNIAQQKCGPRRWLGGGVMLHYIQRRWKQTGWAPALDGVHATCHTGSIKGSSTVHALCTLCWGKRHLRMRVPSSSCFTYMSIMSRCVRTARSVAVSS